MKNLFNIFNPDNKIANFLTKIMYLAWLNFLWLLCSLPIVTIGASTTAVYYTAMRMARDDEGYIARDFFHSFKENFLQATGVWLIVLVFFGMICFNWWNLSGSPNDLLRIASHLFLSLFVIADLYLFLSAIVTVRYANHGTASLQPFYITQKYSLEHLPCYSFIWRQRFDGIKVLSTCYIRISVNCIFTVLYF